MSTAGLRWGRILLYGFLAELMVLVLLGLVAWASDVETAQYLTTVGSFIGVLVFGYLWARQVAERKVLNGVLVGAAAIAIYLATGLIGRIVALLMNVTVPAEPEWLMYVYLAAHVLKLAGGWLGGFLAERASRQSP